MIARIDEAAQGEQEAAQGLVNEPAQVPTTKPTKPGRVRTWLSAKRKKFTTKPAQGEQEVNTKPGRANKTRRPAKLDAVNRTSPVHVEFSSLARLEYGLQWVENLIHILTPRLLVAGFVLSMVDLLTHGSLLNAPGMVYAWAIVQAMAVDATLPNMWRLAATRFDNRRWVSGGFLGFIGAALALVVFAALSIQFLQQAQNITIDQTMLRLGVSPELLAWVRSGSVVFLAGILSVLNRTKVVNIRKLPAQGESKLNAQEPAQEVNHTQEPLNQGEQFTEPLSITTKPAGASGRLHVLNPQHTNGLVNGSASGLVVNSSLNGDSSKQARILALASEQPDMKPIDIARRLGVSKGYVSQVLSGARSS